jgi:hypothetical protein
MPNKDAEFSPTTVTSDGKDIKGYIETMESEKIPTIYVYSAFKENCQHFVRSILNANGITKYDSFISQDTEVLAPSVLQKVAKGVTNLAGAIDVAYRGGSRYPEYSISARDMDRGNPNDSRNHNYFGGSFLRVLNSGCFYGGRRKSIR